MSIWHEIKKQEYVELSEDGKTIDVLYKSDYNGNNYVEIPIEFVKKALPCEHPFSDVMSKCDGEINTCLKCGEKL